MKTGDAFAAFIEWDLAELLKEGRVSADDVYSYLRKLDDLVTYESKSSAPAKIDWIMDAHRIVWFKIGRPERDLVVSIFAFFHRLLQDVENLSNEPSMSGFPRISFRVGIGAGKVAMHEMDKNVLFGDALSDASASSKEARESGALVVVNPVVFQSIRSELTEKLGSLTTAGIKAEMVSFSEAQLASIASL